MVSRCFLCKKKLKLIDSTLGLCKCGNLYCPKHRCVRSQEQESVNLPDIEKNCHPCTWDYLKEQQEHIKLQNPNIQPNKLFI